jgi:hypothetical protein
MEEKAGIREADPSTWPQAYDIEEHLNNPEVLATKVPTQSSTSIRSCKKTLCIAETEGAARCRHNQTALVAGEQIQAPAAASIASTPVRKVG